MLQRVGEQPLKTYETYIPSNASLVEKVFGLSLIVMLALFIGMGLYLHTIKAPAEPVEKKLSEIKTRFIVEEQQKPKPKAVEKKKPVEKAAVEKPIDLTQKPLLAQQQNDAPKEPPPAGAQVVKRVYGLRRVYSVGIGAGGAMADAVIGKLGNTINKDFDTETVTKQELKGVLAPITTVTTAPSPKNTVKPEYTKEMLEAKLEGVIKAQLLIDIDGTVKEVRILNDLGFGTAKAASKAFLQWTFEPAKVNEKPVAVWITYSIRFVMVQ